MQIVTLNDKLHKDLLNVKTPLALRLGLFLLEKVAILESDVMSFFCKNNAVIKKAAYILREHDIIDVVRDNDTYEIYYILRKKYFDINDTCENCKFLLKNKEDELQNLLCSKKGRQCIHKHNLDAYKILKLFKDRTESVSNESFKKKEEVYRKEVTKDNWTHRHFCQYYIDLFKRSYPNMVAPSHLDCRNAVLELIKIFKEYDKENWRRSLRHYISQCIKVYSENRQVWTQFKMTDKVTISVFFNKLGKKIKEVEKCNAFNIYCSFWKGQCTLPLGVPDCSESIRKKMIKKYA